MRPQKSGAAGADGKEGSPVPDAASKKAKELEEQLEAVRGELSAARKALGNATSEKEKTQLAALRDELKTKVCK